VLQRRPNTFAQTNLLPHFSLATKRRTIHSGLPVTRELLKDSDDSHSDWQFCQLLARHRAYKLTSPTSVLVFSRKLHLSILSRDLALEAVFYWREGPVLGEIQQHFDSCHPVISPGV